MAIEVATENEERNLVESFRATSYDGREPWIPALDPAMGTPVVAVRQLEACAAHPACAWRDEVMDEPRALGFHAGVPAQTDFGSRANCGGVCSVRNVARRCKRRQLPCSRVEKLLWGLRPAAPRPPLCKCSISNIAEADG
jgi:hypothetical protein